MSVSNYTLTKQELSVLRGHLTRSVRSGDPKRVLRAVRRAETIFDHRGWPDDWTRWQRAKEDAELQLRMASTGAS